jgi:predicted DNA-binding protein
MRTVLQERMSDDLRQRLDRLSKEYPDPLDQLAKRHALTHALYTYAPIDAAQDAGTDNSFDVRAHTET